MYCSVFIYMYFFVCCLTMPLVVLMFRFWALVEPYCADITNEEIRLLEELLKPPDDEAEYYKVWLINLTASSTPHHYI